MIFPPHRCSRSENGLTAMTIGTLQARKKSRDGQTIISDLASRWEISPGGKTYPFCPRQGVKCPSRCC